MTDILIYGGLGIMFIEGIFGLYVAFRGYKSTDWKTSNPFHPATYLCVGL